MSREDTRQPPRRLADEEARRRIREDLDSTLVVEAAAGTGKTSALVGRLVALIAAGATTLDRLVAVTFTDKAAGEMKLRLRTSLDRSREGASEAERERFDRALEQLETAHIGTIHAFCMELLRQRPVQAAVDPDFAVLDDVARDGLLERAFDEWYQERLDDPPEGLKRVLRRRTWGLRNSGRGTSGRGSGPREQLLGAARALVERRDFDAAWRVPEGFDRDRAIDALVQQAAEVGAYAAKASYRRDWLAEQLAKVARVVEQAATRERTRPRDHDLLEHDLLALAHDRDLRLKSGRGQSYGRDILRADVVAARDRLLSALAVFAADADARLAACLQRELGEVVHRYQELKNKTGALDYIDMLLCARDLLRDDDATRAELQQRFSHLFVDEFQDTDPLQTEILLLLAGDDPAEREAWQAHPRPGKLFLVGDPKQAIYRFRRADVALYQRVKERLVATGASVLHLTTSFRSLPGIQRAVNTSFAAAMAPGAAGTPRSSLRCNGGPGGIEGQAEYVPLTGYREAPSDGQPSVVALSVPYPYGKRDLANYAIEASTPEAVGDFVRWLVQESGWTVEDRAAGHDGGERVPVRARHVCLLFRRMQSGFHGDITRGYVRALEARRVPHVLVGGHAFHAREEILALRAALEAIEWPADELSVYATLHGPFFGFSDEALLGYKSAARLHPLAPVPLAPVQSDSLAGGDREVAEALELLAKLHRRRNRRSIAATIGELLGETRAHASFAIWPSGEQALANLLRSMDEARRFEAAGAISFRSFIDHLERQAEHGQGTHAPVVEEGTDGVRIMSVHAAKGLEFPVVILCDPTMPLASDRPSRYLDPERRLWAVPIAGCVPADLRDHAAEVLAHDRAEAVRVAYVAATRARDLLVVPAVGDGKRSGWVEVLHDALYPPPERRREAVPAPRCPAFGHDSVAARPNDSPARPDESVKPGLHSSLGVVWWDPHVQRLDVEPAGGLRQTALLMAVEQGQGGAGATHERWQGDKQRALEAGARPSWIARPVTALAAGPVAVPAMTPPTRQEQTAIDRLARPRGSRFGTLIHGVLAAVPLDAVPLDAGAEALRAHAAVRGRLLGASAAEIEAAVDAVAAALAHPILRRAARSSDCRRELPMTLCLPDGESLVAEGVVDLAFVEDGRWVVVDFKSDALGPEDAEAAGKYARQIDLYRWAVALATGAPTEGVILWV